MSTLSTDNISAEFSAFQLRLDAAIWDILSKQNRTGRFSEYDLIKALQSEPYELFKDTLLTNTLDLFQTHFILFNALYRLYDSLDENHEINLHIHTLDIYLNITNDVLSNSNSKLSIEPSMLNQSSNPQLKHYYLDWSNFKKTEEQDVVELLNTFWRQYSPLKAQETRDALRQLSLSETTDLKHLSLQSLKKAYRHQSNRLHPDKGGNHDKFAQLTYSYHLIKTVITN